jgi:uncharacterized membrane protein YbhN (UPF0104 family)
MPSPADPPPRRSRIAPRFALGILLSVVLVVLLLRRVPPSTVVAAFGSVRPGPVVGGALVYLAALAVKAGRWAVVLGAIPHPPPSTDRARRWLVLDALFIGFLGNLLLPARLGEVGRAALYARRAGVGLGSVLTTVALGHLLDAFVLAAAFFALFAALPLPEALPPWLPTAARGVGGLAVALLVGLAVADRLLPAVGVQPATSAWGRALQRTRQGLASARAGLGILRSPGRSAAALGLTLGIWVLEAAAILVLMRGFGHALPTSAGVLQTVASGFAAAAPAAPGALGIHQWVTVLTLGPFGVSDGAATAASLMQSAFVLLWTVPFGLLGLWRQGASLRELARGR